jgi:hypothetical protein
MAVPRLGWSTRSWDGQVTLAGACQASHFRTVACRGCWSFILFQAMDKKWKAVKCLWSLYVSLTNFYSPPTYENEPLRMAEWRTIVTYCNCKTLHRPCLPKKMKPWKSKDSKSTSSWISNIRRKWAKKVRPCLIHLLYVLRSQTSKGTIAI